MSLRISLLLAIVLIAAPALAQEAYVTAQLAGEVAVVDLGQGKVIAHIPLDGAPAGIALSPIARRPMSRGPRASRSR